MNYLIEACPNPQLGAVEHQFTQAPEIHVIDETNPEQFRQALWTATTNGEYPSVSYQSLQNEANVKAVQIWFHVVSDTRHWELEPYFDVDGARATGLMKWNIWPTRPIPGSSKSPCRSINTTRSGSIRSPAKRYP